MDSRNLESQKSGFSVEELKSKPAFSGGNLLAGKFHPNECKAWLTKKEGRRLDQRGRKSEVLGRHRGKPVEVEGQCTMMEINRG